MSPVPDPLPDVGELLGSAVDALGLGEEVVGLGLGLGEAVVGLGLVAEVVGLGLGEEVVALGLGKEAVAVRLGVKLAIALWIAPPQPAVRHTARIAAKRKKLRP